MDGGRIAAEGSPRELIAAYSTPEVLELRFAPDAQAEAAGRLRRAELGERIELLPDRVIVYADDEIGRASCRERVCLGV